MPANKHTTQTAIDIAPQKLSEREDQFYNKFDGVYPNINTDPETCKATEIKILSAARPHMRGFHSSWISFFLAFFCWFAIAPLLSTLRLPEEEGGLGISKQDIWTSSIVSVCGTIVMRIVLGPMCDKVSEVSSFSVSATTKLKIIINFQYGPRITMAIVLLAGAIPTGLTGLVNNATGLIIVRLFIGLIGSSFVMCQYWTTTMFTKEVAGTANAIVGGWGNCGGGGEAKSKSWGNKNKLTTSNSCSLLFSPPPQPLSSSWALLSFPSFSPG